MTHINDSKALTEGHWTAEALLPHYETAARALIGDIVRNVGSFKAFARVWHLLATEAAIVGLDWQWTSITTRRIVDAGSPEVAIRKELEENYKIPLTGISDIDIRDLSPRFRGRLDDFLIEGNGGSEALASLRARIAKGGCGVKEASALVEVQKQHERTTEKRAPCAQIISLDHRRRGA